MSALYFRLANGSGRPASSRRSEDDVSNPERVPMNCVRYVTPSCAWIVTRSSLSVLSIASSNTPVVL